ncbi:Retrovirus-related Pol polyprotein from transposon 297 [Vitis vinifera]|uniref:RNA-directed DNA polymerase n=1 Tax=Vitis vinifera TaxID=29760 RepID=A0A438CN62_VITVI|nr:Retrovirus-related Pol polyprotein from transposon 297 [Vitis vinifera]
MKGKKKYASENSEGEEDHGSIVNANPEKELIKEELMKQRTSPPFPQALHGKKGIKMHQKSLKGLNVNKKAFLAEQVSAIIQSKSPLKYKDPGCPTISVMIGGKVVEKALLDLGASVNFLPYSVYSNWDLDVLVQVDNFYYPIDFVVLDTDPTVKEANSAPIILGRSFLATSNAIINWLSEPPDVLATLQGWRRREKILPLFNKEEGEVVEEETPKLNLKPLPVELKYTYLKKIINVLLLYLHLLLVIRRSVYLKFSRGPLGDPYSSGTKEVRELLWFRMKKEKKLPTRLTSGWKVLERVSGHPFYCFLDGYSGYFQIEIDVEDQEKTTFTCSFGTYAYRRMPFGLCNAPATFQRCMLSIFSDMVERIMEVFMDDITVYGEMPFYGTSRNCPCHIISEKGIEVDKAKVELIVKLSSPTTVKGLLAKDAKFVWDERCQKSFDQLKQFLITTPIVRASNWQLPFEVMCDASDFAIGAVLCQREDGKPYVIYYASKTLNEAQRNYTTTEKELLAVVFALDKFRAYLVGSSIIVFTDHSALKYLLTKQDAKTRLIRWILLLQEFDPPDQRQERGGDVVADHLSRLAIAHNSHEPINDDFPEESLMLLEKAPWYAHIANYLVIGEVPSEWNAQDMKYFFAKIHAYYWEEPFLFKYCAIRSYGSVSLKKSNKESSAHCHENACGGHFASQKTAMKVYNQGLLGHRFSKIPTSCVGVVIDAKDSGSLQKETKCP